MNFYQLRSAAKCVSWVSSVPGEAIELPDNEALHTSHHKEGREVGRQGDRAVAVLVLYSAQPLDLPISNLTLSPKCSSYEYPVKI